MRTVAVSLAIAVVPGFAWWLVLQVVSNPDEGANIGGGIVGLVIVLVSLVVAVGFLGTALIKRDEQQ